MVGGVCQCLQDEAVGELMLVVCLQVLVAGAACHLRTESSKAGKPLTLAW